MKKFTFLVIAAVTILSCASETKGLIVFDMVNSDREVVLSNDEGSPQCAVHLQLPYATDENGEKAEVVNNVIMKRLLNMEELTMQQAADSFASSYTSTYARNFLPLYNQDRADTAKRSWYEYHYVITSEARKSSEKTSVVIATIDYYEGGAHSVNQQTTMNFDNETGQLLELDDVFVTGFEGQLNELLTKALMEKKGVNSLRELQEMGFLRGMKMFPSENFIIGDETVTFLYNPYEIATYDQGATELTINRQDLTSILKMAHR